MLGAGPPAHHSMLLERAQPLQQHLLRNARNARLQRAGALRTIQKHMQDDRLPVPGKHLLRRRSGGGPRPVPHGGGRGGSARIWSGARRRSPGPVRPVQLHARRPSTEETLLYVSEQLGRRGVAYLHLVYELMPTANMETAEFQKHHVDHVFLAKVRTAFPGAIIWCGGFTSREEAQAALDTGLADQIALGRPYIGNPDLTERLEHGWPLAERTVRPATPDAARSALRISRPIRRRIASSSSVRGFPPREETNLIPGPARGAFRALQALPLQHVGIDRQAVEIAMA